MVIVRNKSERIRMIDHSLYREKTDEELVALAIQDSQHYLPLMQRYEEKLIRYAERLIFCTREDAEDIVQETFIKTYENLNEFDTTLKFSSWIYRIAHNEAINMLRKTSRTRTISTDAETTDFILENITDITDLEHELGKKMESETLHRALAKIPAQYREVVILKFLEEKSYEEISDILKKPMGTVGTLINRAKIKLREQLEHNV